MIDFFIKVKQQESQNLPLYFTKPDKIKVVGYFQKMIICILKTSRKLVFFAPFEGSQKILIPFDQSVKWSALLTSGEETRDSFCELKINKIKNILNLWCKRN
jgi:isochorismate synthase